METLNPLTSSLRKYRPKNLRAKEYVPNMDRIATIILGGGEGTRLLPLTETRCKPAITFGGRYRLIDIPISNSLHSGCHKIFILTQYLSASLHQHVFRTYRQDSFHSGCVELLSAEQRPSKGGWFKGTADAVRQNLDYFREIPADYFLILSGDQIYSMDYRQMVQLAHETDADLVLGAKIVSEQDCKRLGILKINEDQKITNFVEKPQTKSALTNLHLPNDKNHYLASMGIYLFKRKALFNLLEEDPRHDFGQHLIPKLVDEGKAFAHLFNAYWEDIGTIGSFYEANIALTAEEPQFNCYDESWPIYSSQQHLPSPKLSNAFISQSIICEGALIEADEVRNSILGPRTVIKRGSVICSSYIMGNDFYRPPINSAHLPERLEIGNNCIITKAIVDKNSCIGNNVRLINKNNLSHYDGGNIFIRDGVIVVPRGAAIADGFIL